MKEIRFTRHARKALARMPVNASKLINAKIRRYASDPSTLSRNVVKLQGREGYRLRVGNWRIIFEEEDAALLVLAIGPRGGVYE